LKSGGGQRWPFVRGARFTLRSLSQDMESFADLLRDPSRPGRSRRRNGDSPGGSAYFSVVVPQGDRLLVANSELSWEFVAAANAVADECWPTVLDLRLDDLPRNAIELAAARDALLVG